MVSKQLSLTCHEFVAYFQSFLLFMMIHLSVFKHFMYVM